MENYFNYVTEIEEHFLRRRGGGLLLSTLDWALIETWKDAGIPLEAVLRGIDATFDHFDQKSSRTRKVNGLGFCAQEVLTAAEDMKEAAVGVAETTPAKKSAGFQSNEVSAYLLRNADSLERLKLSPSGAMQVQTLIIDSAKTLRDLASGLQNQNAPRLEDLERRLTVLEEKIFAALLASTPDEQIVEVRAQADRELAPYRRKMPAAQIDQLQKQYVHKRLLERYGVPRLSLFYM